MNIIKYILLQIFKIKRNGEAGSVDTTYDILFANPNIYRSDIYPKDTTLFENYKVIGSTVLYRSAEKMVELLNGAENVATPKSTSAPAAPDTAPVSNQPTTSITTSAEYVNTNEPVRTYTPQATYNPEPVNYQPTDTHTGEELIRPRRLY